MADWPLYGDGQRLIAGTTAASYGVSVSVGGSEHTKGAWVEIASATTSAQPANGFYLHTVRTLYPAWDALFDVAIGGAGAETVIVSNVSATINNSASSIFFFFPIHIPALTRVAVRMQAGNTSVSHYFMMHLVTGGAAQLPPLAGAEGIGVNTADSGGQGITCGNGSKSSWVQITSSAARNYKGFSVGGSTRNSLLTEATVLVDVGIGAAAAEQVILGNHFVKTQDSISQGGYVPIHIPQGSRIAVRAAGSASVNFDLNIVGFY